MGDTMTCITFQYPVVRFDVDNTSNTNTITTTTTSGTTSTAAGGGANSSSATAHKKTPSSSNNSGKTLERAEQGLHEKVAKLCDTVAREWKCSIQSTPIKQKQVPGAAKNPQQLNHLTNDHQLAQLKQHSNLVDKSQLDKPNDANAVLRIIYSVTITGPFHAVMNCKHALIRKNPSQTVITLNTVRNILLSPSGEMKPIVKKRLDDLKQATGTHITCLGGEKLKNTSISSPPEIMHIEIVGESDAAEKARLLCLALLDELFGLSVTQIQVASKFHALIAGRKREALNTIMQETKTNFYLPIPFVILPPSISGGGSATTGEDSSDAYHNTIYITGHPDAIQEASERYLELAKSVKNHVISKQVPCLHRKLDWLFSFRKEKIRKIMADNAVDVSFPTLGSMSNMITVIGTQKNLIDRAIRSVKQVICDCYLASIQTANAVEGTEQFIRFCSDMGPVLTRSNASTGAEVMINRNIVEIYGTDGQTKQAYQDLTSCEVIKIRDTKFQIELSIEHRDFINGKKNGKINRITKTSGCRISFQESQIDINMMIDLYSAIPSCLLMGVSMLEEELPAEMSFHIPETYHKRIIGVGGKNIQKIMKRFGVYVKFSNMEEYEQLGGYYENADNVICRTPSKNADNLRDLKSSIVEAVNATDLLETIDSIDGLPRQLSHWYSGVNGTNISDISQELRVRVYLPDKESGLDVIGLEGPESSLEPAKTKLKESIPLLSNFQVPGTLAVSNLLSRPEFIALKQKLFDDFDITVWVATSPVDTEFDFSFFLIHPKYVTHEQYEEAKQMIVELFNEHKVPFTHVSRSESYANLNTQVTYDSFQHFNSKLLAPVAGGSQSASPGEQPSTLRPTNTGFSSIFGATPNTSGSSVQDIRSLFDDPTSATNAPPGMRGPLSNSVIGRPGATSNLRRTLNENSDYLRHSASTLARPALTMPDLSSMSVNKSSSMTDMINLNDSSSQSNRAFPWGSSTFSKSLSSSAIVPPEYPKAPSDFGNLVSPTDIEFDQKMEDQVQALDKQNSVESDRIARVLESIDHSKYLPLFIEHEIDYQTFLSLEDADLKELGIKALGSRKKILSVIKDLQRPAAPSIQRPAGFDF